MGTQMIQLPFSCSSSFSSSSKTLSLFFCPYNGAGRLSARSHGVHSVSASVQTQKKRRSLVLVLANGEDTPSTSVSASTQPQQEEADPQDLEYVRQIKRVPFISHLLPLQTIKFLSFSLPSPTHSISPYFSGVRASSQEQRHAL